MIVFKQALSRARTRLGLNLEEEADCTLRDNLHILIFSMAFSSIFLNITTASPLTGFLQFIKSGDFIFGLMVSLPYFGAVLQLLGAKTIFRLPKKSKLYFRAAMITAQPVDYHRLYSGLRKKQPDRLGNRFNCTPRRPVVCRRRLLKCDPDNTDGRNRPPAVDGRLSFLA